ncbi:HlyD family secretion protein [Sporomusa sp.]|uniref:HlyD family secretion protein n=1 Tax=Sporomusa sp. TaxID=2078658 RepID=UPI002C15DC30|nr:HlyD family efflux transporter periplasmic adaptor subunit [Sporomusa sp.]HWR44016.1 HlyD family efflux transporter periplasmic adaptor subunit [Sporomusa sp.]
MLRHINNRYTVFIMSGVVITLLSAAVLGGCAKTNPVQEVWGRAEAKEVDVNSKIAGRVISLLVKDGDTVEKGQLLAKIDNRDLAAKANQAKAGIEALEAQLSQAATATSLQDQTAQATLNNAKAQLVKAQADLSLAENDYQRFNGLLESGAVSKQVFDNYSTKYQVAQASYTQAQAAVAAAEAGLLQSQLSRDNEAAVKGKVSQAQASLQEVEVYLDETEIRAPFAGIVTAKYVEEGAMVSTGMPLVAIQDPVNNWVNIKVKETELDKYSLQQPVELEGRDAKLKLPGTIVEISKKPEFATYRATNERGDSDIITFNVKIQVNSEKIRPGMRFKLLNGGK